MEPYVLKNFETHLLPLAGKGPHVCLHLGIQNPSHGEWICRNAVPCVDDRYFGSCDFCGSAALHKTAVDLLAGFSNAMIWPYGAWQFLWETPPAAQAAMKRVGGATLIYIDGSRDHVVFKGILESAWNRLRPGGTCIINGYRTGRRRHELYPVIEPWAMKPDLEIVFENRQFGFRKVEA